MYLTKLFFKEINQPKRINFLILINISVNIFYIYDIDFKPTNLFMITAITVNLERGVKLLNYISDEQYSNTSIAPYYSSIGRHMRHILDVFDCVFEGLAVSRVDLSARKRNEAVELKTDEGIQYFDKIITELEVLKSADFEQKIVVVDDMGMGIIEQNYTLGGILMQAHSHAIHHFASLGYIISQLGIEIPDADFGFNPTTPKKVILST